MKWQWIALCAALGTSLTCQAGDGTINGGNDAATMCERAYEQLPHGTILDLLDPDAPPDRRADALAAYEHLATMQQCPEFGYTLGQLYRQGKYLPGNLVAQDISKAQALIEPMAEDGYLPAFADLAEMQMRQADAREAMKWTQVYLHFVKAVLSDYIDDADAKWYQRTAYNGHLLARTEFVWNKLTRPRLPRKLVKQDLDAYLAEHGDRVTRLMRERMQGQHLRAFAQDIGPGEAGNDADTCYTTPVRGIGSASVSWIVEVLPSGKTGRIVLENFVPNPDIAGKLQACLSHYTFAPFVGTQSRTVRMSMVMGSTNGFKLQRSRHR